MSVVRVCVAGETEFSGTVREWLLKSSGFVLYILYRYFIELLYIVSSI